MVSGSWGNEMTAHLNHFSPGGGRNRNWQVIHLRSAKAGGGGVTVCVICTVTSFSCVPTTMVGWSHFRPTPSWSQSGLVCCWRLVELCKLAVCAVGAAFFFHPGAQSRRADRRVLRLICLNLLSGARRTLWTPGELLEKEELVRKGGWWESFSPSWAGSRPKSEC